MPQKQDIQEERDKRQEHEDKVKGAIGMLSVLALCLLVLVAFYFQMFIKAIKAFLCYRRLICSNSPLSLSALRGRFLTPVWLKYFRHALVFSCSLLLCHGIFALLVVYLPRVLEGGLFVLVLFWLAGTLMSPLFPVFSNDVMSKRTRYLRSLPDSVFEKGVIDHEEIELIRLKRRAMEMRRQRQQDDLRKKYDAEMEQLRKDYRVLDRESE